MAENNQAFVGSDEGIFAIFPNGTSFLGGSGPNSVPVYSWSINSGGTLSTTSLGSITDATFNSSGMKGQLINVGGATWVIVYPSNVTSGGYKAQWSPCRLSARPMTG